MLYIFYLLCNLSLWADYLLNTIEKKVRKIQLKILIIFDVTDKPNFFIQIIVWSFYAYIISLF